MRDVLGGMEELAVMKHYETSDDVFEVISIDPSEAEKDFQPEEEGDPKSKEPVSKAEVISLDKFRKPANKKE